MYSHYYLRPMTIQEIARCFELVKLKNISIGEEYLRASKYPAFCQMVVRWRDNKTVAIVFGVPNDYPIKLNIHTVFLGIELSYKTEKSLKQISELLHGYCIDAFNLGVHKVVANFPATFRLLEKIFEESQFTKEGHFRQDGFMDNDKYGSGFYDILYYGLLESEVLEDDG